MSTSGPPFRIWVPGRAVPFGLRVAIFATRESPTTNVHVHKRCQLLSAVKKRLRAPVTTLVTTGSTLDSTVRWMRAQLVLWSRNSFSGITTGVKPTNGSFLDAEGDRYFIGLGRKGRTEKEQAPSLCQVKVDQLQLNESCHLNSMKVSVSHGEGLYSLFCGDLLTQQKKSSSAMMMSSTMTPITMPAMAPPLSPPPSVDETGNG